MSCKFAVSIEMSMGITIVVTMIDILLNVSLFLVMFSIWCQVDIEHLKRHLKKPKALLLWLLLQLTMPPLLAVLMIQLFDYEWVEALGVLLWAASSWWVTSAIVTNRAKGDTELSVSMTTLNSMIISLTTLPLLLTVWYLHFMIIHSATTGMCIGVMIQQTPYRIKTTS